MKNNVTPFYLQLFLICSFMTLTPIFLNGQITIFSENFESVPAPAIPAFWTTENPNGGFLFMTGDSTAANSGGFWAIDPHGQFAFASDDACNCDMSEVRLILPAQNLNGISSASINASVWLDNVYGSAPFETARLEVSLDNGTSWNPVGSDFTPLEAWQTISIDLSAYDGLSNVLIAFRFDDNGNWGRGLAVDDVEVRGFTSGVCFYSEDFESVAAPALPPGWTTDNPNGGFEFMTGDSTAANSGGFWAIDPHGQFAFASDDACNCDMSEVRLMLPLQDFTNYTSITLKAEVWLDNVYGSAPFETARVEVSTNNGTNWLPVGSDFTPIESWQAITINLSGYAGLSNVLVAFRFDDNGNWGRGLAVDNVCLEGGTDVLCLFSESFQGVTAPALPAGWTTENPNGGFTFMTGDSTDANSGGFWAIDPHGQFAFASDDACNCDMSEVRLILPPQNFSGVSFVTLNAEVWLDNVYGSAPFETARLEVSLDNGTSWNPVGADFAPIEAWQTINKDLSAYDGMNNVLIAFRFDDNGNWGRGLAVDNLCIQGLTNLSCDLNEGFDIVAAPALPVGWTTDNPNGGFEFMTGDSTDANSGGFWAIDPRGQFAFASDDACNCDMSEVRLILPPQDFTASTIIQLSALVWLDNVYGSAPFETARVEISTNSGTTWTAAGSDFTPVEAWQNIIRDLSAWAGQNNVWIAFRFDDNGNWGRGLAVDDVKICQPTSGFETEITSVSRLNPEYTIVPESQETGAIISAEVTNTGSEDVTNLVLSSRLFEEGNPIVPVATLSSAPVDLSSGASVTIDNNPGGLPIGGVGRWYVEHTISHDDSGDEFSTLNDTMFTPIFEISEFVYARDDTSSTDQGGFGIGGGTNDNGFIGQTFEFFTEVYIESIEAILDSPDPGMELSAAIFACDATGTPTGVAIDTTEVQLAAGGGGDETFSLMFNSTVTLSPGIYLFAVLEPAGNIGVKGYADIYTPPSGSILGTNWVNWDGVATWTEPTTIVPSFAVAYAIRPFLAAEPCSPGDLAGGGGPATVCGSASTFNFATDGTEEIPSTGGWGWNFVPGPGATGGVATGFSVTSSSTNIDFDADLNGFLSTNGLLPLVGTWNVQGFSYADSLDTGGSFCDFTPSTFEITFSPDMVISATTVDPLCGGEANGSIELTVSGGIPPYTYAWSNGAMTEDLNNLTGGTYQASITDAAGCTAISDMIVINEPVTITATPVVDHILCNGESSGRIELIVAGGTPPYSYLWSNGATDPGIKELLAGFYSVTITDANGCVLSIGPIEIIEPEVLTANYSVIDVLCHGESTGSIDLNVMGGTLPYSFTWSNNSISEDLNNISAGSYSVAIADANGCTLSIGPIEVTEPDALVWSFTSTNILCNGEATGSIDLTVSDSAPPYTFLWSDNSTTEDLTNITAGTYQATVTNANGCTVVVGPVTISEPDPLIWNVETSDVICYGESSGHIDLMASGGVLPLTYLWSNGSTEEDLENIPAGTYAVTITDANGCMAVPDSIMINEPEDWVWEVFVIDAACHGESSGIIDLWINGGTQPYTFVWSNGTFNEDLEEVVAGEYTATVTDANGCQEIVGPIEIEEPEGLFWQLTSSDVSCHGDLSGSIDLTVSGGVSPYDYAWSNGSNTEDLENISGGSYQVIVTDASGCSTMIGPIEINEPDAISVELSVIDVICNGDSNGSIDLTVSGGVMPYSFTWSNGLSTEDLTGISGGTYEVSISDANGCSTGISSIIVSEPSAINADASIQDVGCHGESTGSIDLTVSGGVGTYSFAWSNGATTEDVTNLPAGSYEATVTGGKGCEIVIGPLLIDEPDSLILDLGNTIVNPTSCFGDADGSIDITMIGGTPPYSFAWSNGNDTEDLFDIPIGDFSVTVTDANGCVFMTSNPLSVTEPAEIITEGVVTEESAPGAMDGSVALTVSGGIPPYSYDWSNGATTADIQDLESGDFTVTITDANGCTSVSTWSVQLSVSVENVEGLIRLSLYPNPSFDLVTLEMSFKNAKQVKLDLIDLSGKVISSFPMESVTEKQFRWSMADSPAGIYLARCTIDGQVVTKRFTMIK